MMRFRYIPKILQNATFTLMLFSQKLRQKVRNRASYDLLFLKTFAKKACCLKYRMLKYSGHSLLMGTLIFLPCLTEAADSYYCPQNHKYISVGMTQGQVIEACGQPTAVRDANNPVVKQIPVTQLIYSILNKGAMYYNPGITPLYNMWSLPSGSEGTSVELDLIENQVNLIKINGSETNALSICQGGRVQIGDSLTTVYNACGAPSQINNTYINQPIPSKEKPQVWIYTIDQYQPSVTLTIINGILQSIH